MNNDKIVTSVEELTIKLRSVLTVIEGVRAPLTRIPNPQGVSEADVKRLIRTRRARDKFFSPSLFADPAWDMLLELYAAELGQRRISVSSLCVGAAVPPTTALRWIGTLEKEHLIERSADKLDGRRIFVTLSADGKASLEAFFAANYALVANVEH